MYDAAVAQSAAVSPSNQTIRNPQFLVDGRWIRIVKTTSAGFGAVTGALPYERFRRIATLVLTYAGKARVPSAQLRPFCAPRRGDWSADRTLKVSRNSRISTEPRCRTYLRNMNGVPRFQPEFLRALMILRLGAFCSSIGGRTWTAGTRGSTPAAGQQPPEARWGGGGRGNAAATLFANTCAPCNGTDLAGGRAPTLFSERLLASNDDEALAAKIRDGVPNTAMVPFKSTLDDQQIWQLVAYIRTQAANLKDKPVFVPDPNNQIIKSERQTFRIEVVATGLETPWGLAFLPDGRLLVTERSGRLRIIDKGKLVPDPVQGTPKVWERQDSGMLDVAIHPQYAETDGSISRTPKWSQVCRARANAPASDRACRPAVAAGGRGRGEVAAQPSVDDGLCARKIDKTNHWVEEQVIYRALPICIRQWLALWHPVPVRQGRAPVLQLGERGDMTNAQESIEALGKIHRVNDDGSIPKDNPFVNTPNALPSIWTYGHRNPQGWRGIQPACCGTEHGPTVGMRSTSSRKAKTTAGRDLDGTAERDH